jgi:myo-inositol 2-dehydrogenase / D-chiro-inositol 1-dehydrogenase
MVLSDNPQATGFKRFSSTSFRALDRFRAFFIERYSESYRLEIEAFPNGLALGQSASANATDSLRAVYLAGAAEHLSA